MRSGRLRGAPVGRPIVVLLLGLLMARCGSESAPPDRAPRAKPWPIGAPLAAIEQEVAAARQAGDRREEAQLLILLADQLETTGELARGETEIRKALALLLSPDDATAAATVALKCGKLAYGRGAYSQAEEDLGRALASARQVRGAVYAPADPPEPTDYLLGMSLHGIELDWPPAAQPGLAGRALEAMATVTLGEMAFIRGDYAAADRQSLRALELARDLGGSLEAALQLLLGKSAAKQGKVGEAREHLTSALSLLGGEECPRASPESLRLCTKTLVSLCDLERDAQQNDQALRWNGQALQAAERLGDALEYLDALSSRCLLLPSSGLAPKRELLSRAEALLATLQKSPTRLRCLVQVSAIAQCAERPEKVLAYALEAENLLRDYPNPELAVAIRTLADTAQKQLGIPSGIVGDLEETPPNPSGAPTARAREMEAERKVLQAIYQGGGTGDATADLLRVLEELNVSARGRSEIKAILDSLRRAPSPQAVLSGWAAVQAILEREGVLQAEDSEAITGTAEALLGRDPKEAAERMIAVLEQSTAATLPGRTQAERFLAQTILAIPDRDAALKLARKWVKTYEDAADSGRIAGLDLLRSGRAREAYETLLRLLLRSQDPAEAFAVAERARALSLMRWLGRLQPDPQEGVDSGLLRALKLSKAEIRRLEKSLETSTEAEPEELARAIEAERSRFDELLLRLKLTHPGYSELATAAVADLPRVQRALSAGTTLVSFFTLPEKTLAWVVERETWRLRELELPRRDLAESVRKFRAAVATKPSPMGQGNTKRVDVPETISVEDLGAELYRELIAPLGLAPGTRRLLLLPHDALHELPFAALLDPQTHTYLGQKLTLSLLPSASALLVWQGQARPGEPEALVLGDPTTSSLRPLPAAREEARQVAELLHRKALLGDEAKESALRGAARSLTLLHIAAHGVLDEQEPRNSYLALAEDEGQDGHLEMGEIFDELRLNQRPLVVLSACETGLGRRAGGDEIEGMIRAFLYAGARAVTATLWEIDDPASELLVKVFYRSLLAGAPVAEALRQAQATLIADRGYKAPYYWAGFAVTGDPGLGLAERGTGSR